jgi:hypothetical protein
MFPFSGCVRKLAGFALSMGLVACSHPPERSFKTGDNTRRTATGAHQSHAAPAGSERAERRSSAQMIGTRFVQSARQVRGRSFRSGRERGDTPVPGSRPDTRTKPLHATPAAPRAAGGFGSIVRIRTTNPAADEVGLQSIHIVIGRNRPVPERCIPRRSSGWATSFGRQSGGGE